MERLLQQLVEGQKKLFEGQEKLFKGQERMEARLDKLDGDMTSVKEDMTAVKAEMGTKVQQNEHSQLLAALLHRAEEMDARFDGLLHNTASKEMVTEVSQQQAAIHQRLDRMAMDVNFLVRKAAEHEADIFEFKKVK